MSWDFWSFPQANWINAQTGRWKHICWKSCAGANTELTWRPFPQKAKRLHGFMSNDHSLKDSLVATDRDTVLAELLAKLDVVNLAIIIFLYLWFLLMLLLAYCGTLPSIDNTRMIYPVRPLYWNASDTCFPMNKCMAQRFPKVWFRALWYPALISNAMQHSFPLWLPLFRLKTVVTNCLVPIKRKRLKPNYLSTWHPTPLLAVPQSVSAPSTLSAGYPKQLPLHFMSRANISETAAVRSVPWAVGDWRDVTGAF